MSVPITDVRDPFGNELSVVDVGEHVPTFGPQVTVEIKMRSREVSVPGYAIVDLDRESARKLGESLIAWASET